MIEIAGRHVTFTPPPGATHLIGDFTDWDERPLPLAGPVTLEFPHGAYVEYAFLDAAGCPIADPDNPTRPGYPWYDYHRALMLPGSQYVRHAELPEPTGTVHEHALDSPVRGRQQRYWVYEPAVSPQSTLYVLDGDGYHKRLSFERVADALIKTNRITPVRMVFVEPNDRQEEYWLCEPYADFLLSELLPAVSRDYSPVNELGIWGASLGGLFAAWIAWRHPDVFSKVGSQSGCFTAAPREGRPDANYYRDPEWLTDYFAREERRPIRLYVDTGQIEWLLAPNHRFAAALASQGYKHRYREHPSGHNWTTWQQGLEPGLLYLYSKRPDDHEDS